MATVMASQGSDVLLIFWAVSVGPDGDAATVSEMKVDPSRPVVRFWLQTAASPSLRNSIVIRPPAAVRPRRLTVPANAEPTETKAKALNDV
jgi:hypothetical protein